MKSKIVLNKVAQIFNKALAQELKDQGHYLTGALERSLNASRVIENAKNTELNGWALDYAQDLEAGQNHIVKLPTVDELYKYFKLRGLAHEQAKIAAVLTARRQKVEGMPTIASKRFSKTGERKHFIERTWKSQEQKIDSLVSLQMDNIFNDEVNYQKSETI